MGDDIRDLVYRVDQLEDFSRASISEITNSLNCYSTKSGQDYKFGKLLALTRDLVEVVKGFFDESVVPEEITKIEQELEVLQHG